MSPIVVSVSDVSVDQGPDHPEQDNIEHIVSIADTGLMSAGPHVDKGRKQGAWIAAVCACQSQELLVQLLSSEFVSPSVDFVYSSLLLCEFAAFMSR